VCLSLSCTFKRPVCCAIRKWANSLKRECRQQKSHCAALVALWTLVPVAVNGHHTWEFEIVERTECYFCHGPADSGRGEVRCMFFFSLVSPSIPSPFCMWLLQLETETSEFFFFISKHVITFITSWNCTFCVLFTQVCVAVIWKTLAIDAEQFSIWKSWTFDETDKRRHCQDMM